MKWICCQLGARMHYGVPRVLHIDGSLERFYTDIYAKQNGWTRLLAMVPSRLYPSGLRRLLGRSASGLPEDRIYSYPLFGLKYYRRLKQAHDPEAVSRIHLWGGQHFGQKVIRDGFGKAEAVYTFNTAGLEILIEARKRGLFTVVEQTIVPRFIEEILLEEAEKCYGGWEPKRGRNSIAQVLAQREREEWKQADLILCGSEFVRDGIQRCGGPVERCVVVPYGVDSHFMPSQRNRNGKPLRVLTVGQVGLRKGAGTVLEVAKALDGVANFRWVGPVGLTEAAKAKMSHHIELTGGVARSEIAKHYDWADVFFLPSVCEGSATVTYEALACGLPVITTPNAGSIVRDGLDGFILPVYDALSMAKRLRQLHENRTLLAQMSDAAVNGSGRVSIAAYQNRLLNVLSRNRVR